MPNFWLRAISRPGWVQERLSAVLFQINWRQLKSRATKLNGVRSGPRPVARRSLRLPRNEIAPWLRGSGAFSVGSASR